MVSLSRKKKHMLYSLKQAFNVKDPLHKARVIKIVAFIEDYVHRTIKINRYLKTLAPDLHTSNNSTTSEIN